MILFGFPGGISSGILPGVPSLISSVFFFSRISSLVARRIPSGISALVFVFHVFFKDLL